MRRWVLAAVAAPGIVALICYGIAAAAFAFVRFVIGTDEPWTEITVDGDAG